MIRRILKLLHKNRAGFTLVEVLVSIAITGFIAMGVSVSIAQVINQTHYNNNYTTASRNTMNALQWMSRDALMAQTISGTAGFPVTEVLSMKWKNWDNAEYTANYSLANGQLRRTYSDGVEVTTTLIAEHINPNAAKTNCVSDNGTVTITITSSIGANDKIIDVTKVREVSSRPEL
ncbi:MAG: prepilin-type N-terminal cleavage/methylation domain-containing protein [Dehalococcoidales bacterium]|jgi:prepilin-type N-terminal cleavage/methylation domain-containing protein